MANFQSYLLGRLHLPPFCSWEDGGSGENHSQGHRETRQGWDAKPIYLVWEPVFTAVPPAWENPWHVEGAEPAFVQWLNEWPQNKIYFLMVQWLGKDAKNPNPPGGRVAHRLFVQIWSDTLSGTMFILMNIFKESEILQPLSHHFHSWDLIKKNCRQTIHTMMMIIEWDNFLYRHYKLLVL